MNIRISEIDFSQLLDVRVDYIFKLIFGSDERRLISLINAIFANKRLDRVVTGMSFINPDLKKQSEADKFSIIDVMATLSNGSTVCVEMHLYGLREFKYKSIRTWAKVYGDELKESQKYWENRPVICISFLDGAITDAAGEPLKAIHTLFQVHERDSHEHLMTDMELHYINMRAFVSEHRNCDAPPDMFTKWLTLITQSEQGNKEYLKEICREDEVIAMTVEVLASMSVEDATRLAYSRRKDEMTHYYAVLKESEENRRSAEEDRRRAEESDRRAEEDRRRLTNAIKAMRARNWPVADIAGELGLTEEEIGKYL
jgi:predicted transposase/invertase (TIGR01784 family)